MALQKQIHSKSRHFQIVRVNLRRVKKQSQSNKNANNQESNLMMLIRGIQDLLTTINREQKQKDIYESMISAMKDEIQNSEQKQIKSFDAVNIDIPALTICQPARDSNGLQDKIEGQRQKIDELQRKLVDGEQELKLLKKDLDFSQKQSQTVINHLKLENERLKEQIQNQSQQMTSDFQQQIELNSQAYEKSFKDLNERFEAQMSDLKFLHLQEKSILQSDYQKVKNELKMLKIEHSELISNTDLGEQIERLHDEYINEMHMLNQQLQSKYTENMMLIESMERERNILQKKIHELEDKIKQLKDSKAKEKREAQGRNSELKSKLEKAFQQLTANDQAAQELQRLRVHIKEIQVLMDSQKQEKSIQEQRLLSEQNEEINKMDVLAKNLQKQIVALKGENSKLKHVLKKSIQSVRSQSPNPLQISKEFYSRNKYDAINNCKRKGYASPQSIKSISSDDQGTALISKHKICRHQQQKTQGFLCSSRLKNQLQIQDFSQNDDLLSMNNETHSQQITPQSKLQINTQFIGDLTQRLNCSRQNFFIKNTFNNDITGQTMNTTVASKAELMASKKNISQSLSSNLLAINPISHTTILEQLQLQIEAIKCSGCSLVLNFEEFMQHRTYCSQRSNSRSRYGAKVIELSPISSDKKLAGLNTNDSIQQSNQRSQMFDLQTQSDFFDGGTMVLQKELGNSNSNNNILIVNEKPSFFSSGENTSFIEKVAADNNPQSFSPNRIERESEYLQQKSVRQLEDRVKMLENLFKQSQENTIALSKELRNKTEENEKVISDLKSTKIHIALLEETTAQREFQLKNENDILKKQIEKYEQREMMNEVKLNTKTTNVTCFNIGCTSVTNAHELQIDTKKIMERAADTERMRRKSEQIESVYQQKSENEENLKRGEMRTRIKEECGIKNYEIKRLKSENQIWKYNQGMFENSKHSQSVSRENESCNITQDVQPEDETNNKFKNKQIYRSRLIQAGSPKAKNCTTFMNTNQ